MWHDHPFSERNNATIRAEGGGGVSGRGGQNLKKGGIGTIGGLHKIGKGG